MAVIPVRAAMDDQHRTIQGLNVAPLVVPMREVMLGCRRYAGTREDTAMVLDLLGSGRLRAERLVTRRFALSQVNEALRAVARRNEPMWMGVVLP